MHNFIKTLIRTTKLLNIVVLFVEYDRGIPRDSNHVFNTLDHYLQPVTGCHFTFIRIDNKHEDLSMTEKGAILTVGGDNRYREFSGWQKGVEIIDRLNIPCDLVLFVNDMFLAPGESFLKDYASHDLFQKSLCSRAIIGRIDTAGQYYTALGHDVSRWVCSNCFIAPKTAIDAVNTLVSVREDLNNFLEKVFPGPPPFKTNAPMNDNYKAWLEEWLTKKWHSRFEINETSWDAFRSKVRNILNEALLTARFLDAGYPPMSYGEKKYY